MAHTQEPPGLAWINNLNMTTFGPLISQVCWLAGSLAFTALACYLMTRPDYYAAVGAFDDRGFRQLIMVTRETTRTMGQTLASLLLAAWTGKTVVGAVDAHNKRKVYADEKTKMADAVASVAGTSEHPIATLSTNGEGKVEAKIEAQPRQPDGPKWDDGRDPEAGIL